MCRAGSQLEVLRRFVRSARRRTSSARCCLDNSCNWHTVSSSRRSASIFFKNSSVKLKLSFGMLRSFLPIGKGRSLLAQLRDWHPKPSTRFRIAPNITSPSCSADGTTSTRCVICRRDEPANVSVLGSKYVSFRRGLHLRLSEFPLQLGASHRVQSLIRCLAVPKVHRLFAGFVLRGGDSSATGFFARAGAGIGAPPATTVSPMVSDRKSLSCSEHFLFSTF